MIKRNLNDLLSFVAVAREGTFTRAAAQLGVTQSALSQSISGLEARLQIRLLTRTTRSVSPTAAGERLLNAIGNRFDEIEAELDELSALRDKPSGTVRITCGDHIQRTLLLPRLTPLLLEYPDIKVEFDINYGFRDIVADRFDAGVRLGDTIDKDMIAVPIGPPVRMAVVAAPAYFAAAVRRRPVCLGFSAERSTRERPCRWTAHFQHLAEYRGCRAGGAGNRLAPRRGIRSAYRGGPVAASAGKLVPTVPWLLPVLPEPSATIAGFQPGRGCAALHQAQGNDHRRRVAGMQGLGRRPLITGWTICENGDNRQRCDV